MNNIQKMENKAYRAYLKELQSDNIDKGFYNWASSDVGRRLMLKGIRLVSKTRVEILNGRETVYEAIKSQRDYSFRLVKLKGE